MRYQIGYAMRDGNTYTLGIASGADCLRVAERRIASIEVGRRATCAPGFVPADRVYFISDDHNLEAGDHTDTECRCPECDNAAAAEGR